MKSVFAAASLVLSIGTSSPVAAALKIGDSAPDFSTQGAYDGMLVIVDLAELLKRGLVVVYFFPTAFTDSAETRDFAKNFERFRAAGASVVGISRDSVDTLARFSAEECGGKFPVASASESLVNAFDVNDGAMFNTRTTYVVAPSGKIVFVHDDNDYRGHVRRTLAFVMEMKKQET